MSARRLASILGTLESCRPAIWQAPLHFRSLQIQLIQALHNSNQDFEIPVTLDHNSLGDLNWWLANVDSVNGSAVTPPAPTLFITSDASMEGWGATYQAQRTNGRWSHQERTQNINVLELKAAFLPLKSFLKDQAHKVVCLRIDNTTALSYLMKVGGEPKICLCYKLPNGFGITYWNRGS